MGHSNLDGIHHDLAREYWSADHCPHQPRPRNIAQLSTLSSGLTETHRPRTGRTAMMRSRRASGRRGPSALPRAQSQQCDAEDVLRRPSAARSTVSTGFEVCQSFQPVYDFNTAIGYTRPALVNGRVAVRDPLAIRISFLTAKDAGNNFRRLLPRQAASQT